MNNSTNNNNNNTDRWGDTPWDSKQWQKEQLQTALNEYQPQIAIEEEAINNMKKSQSTATLRNNVCLLDPKTPNNIDCWNVIACVAKSN